MAITEATIQKIALKVFNQQFAPTLRRSKLNLSSLNNDVGYTTAQDIKDHYLSIEWFNSLFQAVDSNKNPILPNDGDLTAVDSIKTLLGFWTEEYISALGQGSGGGGGGGTLAGLYDVNLTNLQNGDVLVYDAATTHWINQQPSAAIDMTTVWNALAGNTNEQINASHLADALTGYVTSSGLSTILANYVTTSGLATTLADYVTTSALATTLADYVTTSGLATALADYVTTSGLATTLADYVTTTALATTLADYATKTYVDQNYLSLSFFNALFQARTSQGAVVAPNSGDTTTIDNIKAMFGFWTDQYLSALGQGSDGGAITSLAALTDVQLSMPLADGEVLTYSTTLGKWTNGAGVSTAWANITGKPTTIAGYGITDAHITNGVITLGANSITPLTSETYTGTVTSVATGTGLTGGTITSSGTISIDSTYQTYISHGESAYNSLGNYLPLNGGTISGTIIFEQTSSTRTRGIIGTYDPYRAAAIWAMGSSYQISNDGYSFGTLYGAAYAYFDSSYTFSGYSGGHSFLWCQSGVIYCALGNYIWAKNGFKKDGSSNDYVLLGGGGHAAISNLSVSYASSAGSVAWGNVSGRPTALSSFTNDSGYITSSALNSYLPLSGGTMTGAITLNNGVVLNGGSSALQVTASSTNSYFGCMNASYLHIYTDAPAVYFNKNNIYANGSLIWHAGNDGSGSGLDADLLDGLHLNDVSNSDANKVVRTDSNGYTQLETVQFQSDKGLYWPVSHGTYKIIASSNIAYGGIAITGTKNSYAGINIGDSNNCITLMDNGGTYSGLFISNWKWILCANRPQGYISIGSFSSLGGFFNVYGDFVTSGGVSALSDIRRKEILNDTNIKVEDIARMRSVAYRWNDGRDDNEIHVGSIAQDWQGVLPEVVMRANDAEGTLSLQYGVAALVSSITIAKKVVNHEERIKELEKENEYLREEINRLKIA